MRLLLLEQDMALSDMEEGEEKAVKGFVLLPYVGLSVSGESS